MKNLFILFFALLALNISFMNAYAIEAMCDDELSEVHAKGLEQGFIQEVKELAKEDGKISPEEFVGRLAGIASKFGINLEGMKINGVSYGDFTMLVKDGKKVGTYQLPSHFDSITFDSVSLGTNGKSIGSLEFQNLNIKGSMSVEVHRN